MLNKYKPITFGKANYFISLIGILLIVGGFVVIYLEKNPQGIGFMGLTLGPILLILGYLIIFLGIMYKKTNDNNK